MNQMVHILRQIRSQRESLLDDIHHLYEIKQEEGGGPIYPSGC